MVQELGIRIRVDGSGAAIGIENVTGSLRSLGTNVEGINRSAASATASLARMGHAAAAAFSVGQLAQAADAWTSISASLKIATGSAQAGAQAYGDVLRIALATGQTLGETSNVYRRFADNADALGLSQKDVAAATTTVAQAIALSGGSAASSQAALVQFGQALASGTLRGEELNSVLEQAPDLARTLADGLGVPIGKLRELAEQGQITGEEIVRALSGQADRVADRFSQMPVTIGRALTNLKTSFTDTVGSFEKSTGVFNVVAQGVDGLARNLDTVATAGGVVAAVMGGRVVASLAAAAAAKAADATASVRSAQATAAATAAAQTHAAMLLAEAQASAAAATGMQRLAIVQAEVIPLQQRLAAATAASTAATGAASVGAGLARGALGLLGGPIGLITTALTLGATAWSIWGQKTETSVDQAAKSATEKIDAILRKVEEMNGRLAETSRKSFDGTINAAAAELEKTQAEMKRRQGTLDSLNSVDGKWQSSNATKRLQAELNALTEREVTLQGVLANARAHSGEVGTAALTRFVEANAVGADKISAQQRKLVSEFADAIRQTGGEFDAQNARHAQALRALNAGLADAAKKGQHTEKITEYDRLSEALEKYLPQLEAERLGTEALTQSQKIGLEIERKLTESQKAALAPALARARAKEQELAQYKATVQAANAAYEEEQKRAETLKNSAAATAADAQKIREHTEEIGLSTLSLAALRGARIDDLITLQEHELAEIDATGKCTAYSEALRDNVAALKERRAAIDGQALKQVSVDAEKEASAAWSKLSEDVGRGLTDSLYRSFESGKGFGETFFDSLTAMAKSTVLKIAVQGIVQGGMNALGMGAAGNGVAGGGIGVASNALSLGNTLLGGSGSAFSAIGTSSLLGNTAFGAGLQYVGANGVLSGLSAVPALLEAGEGMMALGAALPGIGTAIAAIALISSLMGDGGGPKTEGDYFGTLGAGGSLTQSATATGGSAFIDDHWFTAHSADAQMAAAAPAIGAAIYQTVKSLGGDATGMGINYGYNTDPQGTAPDNVAAALTDKNGNYVYKHVADTERGKSSDAMALEIQRMTLAAIGAAEGIPGVFKNIVSGIDLITASAEQMTAALKQITDTKTIIDFTELDPFAAWQTAADTAAEGLMGVWQKQENAARKLIETFDGSATSTASLAASVTALAQAEAQVVAYLNQAIAATRASTASDAESMYLSTLDNQGQYQYRMALSSRYEDAMATATTPEEVIALNGQLRGNYQAAWGLLSPEQQRQYGAQFFGSLDQSTGQFTGGYLGDLQSDTEASLAPFGDAIAESHDPLSSDSLVSQLSDVLGILPDKMQAVVDDFAAVMGRFEAAAAAMEVAANTPVEANVTVFATVAPGVEVNA